MTQLTEAQQKAVLWQAIGKLKSMFVILFRKTILALVMNHSLLRQPKQQLRYCGMTSWKN